ncbi:MAG: hypothetical protein EP341_09575 [Sphingomonadales bacterium]|nr:MAG: hypothetical protein EP341_09575 [Sphingomonadales bacterium]
MIYQGSARYPVREAIIHCSATRPDWMEGAGAEAKRDEIDRWHKSHGWRGIGYHRVIDRDGKIAMGRSLYQVGAHVRGHNRGTVGICLIGAFGAAATDDFSDHFTEAQRHALRGYLRDLARLTDLQKVTGHNDYAAKGCPGFKVRKSDWL